MNNPDNQLYSNTKTNPFVNYSSPITDPNEYSTIQDLFKSSNIENLINNANSSNNVNRINKKSVINTNMINNINGNRMNNNIMNNNMNTNIDSIDNNSDISEKSSNYNPLEVKNIDEDVLRQVKSHKSQTFRKVGPQIDSTVDYKGDKYTDKFEVIEQNQPKIGYYGKTRLSR